MKNSADIVRGWLRKAASDVVMMDAGSKAEAYDGACFHAQQAAEKYLKSFLAFHDQPFPYTHNLGDLTELCAGIDTPFRTLTPQAAELTPYAVRLRCDDAFWPTADTAKRARVSALSIRDLVLQRLPKDVVDAAK